MQEGIAICFCVAKVWNVWKIECTQTFSKLAILIQLTTALNCCAEAAISLYKLFCRGCDLDRSCDTDRQFHFIVCGKWQLKLLY